MYWLDLLAVQEILKSLLHTTVQKHQFFGAQITNPISGVDQLGEQGTFVS